MIETKRTVTTIDGKKIVLESGGPQILECVLTFRFIDNATGCAGAAQSHSSVHITREPLERAGLLPDVVTRGKQLPPITTESLVVQLLEHLGVKFEE